MRILAIPLSAEMHSDIVDACRVLCDLPSLLQFTQDDPSLIHESPPIWLLALVDLCVLQGDAAPLERIAGIIEQRAKDGIVSRQQVSQVVQVLLKGGRVAAALRLVRDVLLSPLPGPAAESVSERLPRSLTSSLVAALVKANDAVCLRTFAEMLATDHQRFDLDGDALSQLLLHIIAVRDTQIWPFVSAC
ncbi:hypothetical protein BC831DRAFT_103723 [Entophlyctis helioformis]|nr:hypothetical protein BC831DRAFT_103723 [Entophlyctis helioformis]